MNAKTIFVFLFASFLLSSRASGMVNLTEFFPFGPSAGDLEVSRGDETNSPEVHLHTPFPFFDELHSTLWINANGGISFLKPIDKYVPFCGAPTKNDHRIIMPFWFVSIKFYYWNFSGILNKSS